jgi:hypothetical protein
MAASESIRSASPAQPLAHSPKLRTYQFLYLLNEKLDEAVRLLRRLENCPGLRRDFLRAFAVEVEELRAETNSELAETLLARELKDWARFGKLRRQRDARLEDPDDVYLKAQDRNEQRQKQGLPPRAVILPNTDDEKIERPKKRARRK